MKFTHFALVVCAFLLAQAVFAQTNQPIAIPAGTTFPQMHYHPAPDPNAAEAPLAGSTIPTWNYSVVSPVDKKTYTGTIIGNNPATKPGGITGDPDGDRSGAARLQVQRDHKLHFRSDRC